MKIRELSVLDEVYDAYVRHAEQLQATTGNVVAPEELMRKHLERFKDIAPFEQVVVIDAGSRARLEEILCTSLQDAKQIVEKVDAVASLEIGGVKWNFSPGMLHQLRIRAGKNNRTVEQEVDITLKEMSWRFFDAI